MNYGDVKRLNTVVTENEYFENKIGVEREGGEEVFDAPAEKVKRTRKALAFPRLNFAFLKNLRTKLDVYDAIMIPVGAGILVAFVMLIMKII
jgi:hypothetical protein